MRVITFITEPPAVNTIPRHLGEPTTPPEAACAGNPCPWDQVV